MSNNSPHFFSSKSPDFTSDSKDHTPTGGEDFKACEASKKREAAKGREAEKRSEAIKGNEIKEGYKVKKGSEAEKEREVEKGREAEKRSEAIKGNEIKEGYKIKEGNEIKEGYKVKEVSETEIISLSQAKNPDQHKHITPLHKGRGEPREARRGGGALLSTTYFGPVQWYQKLNRHRCIIEQHDNFVKQTYRNRCVIASANGPQTLTVPIERYDGMKCAMRDIRISDHGNWRHLHWQALVSAYGETPFFEYYADDIRPFFEEHRWKYLLDFNLDITHTLCSLLDVRPDLTLSDHYIDADETICGSGSLSGAAAGFEEANKGLNGAAESFGGANGLDGATESFGGAVKRLGGAAESFGGAVKGLDGAAESFGGAFKGLDGAAGSFGGAVKGLDGAAESFGGAVKGLGGANSLNGAAESLGSSSACSLFVDYRDAIRPKHPLPDAEFEARPYYQVRAQRHGFLPNLSVLDLLFNEGPEGIFWLL